MTRIVSAKQPHYFSIDSLECLFAGSYLQFLTHPLSLIRLTYCRITILIFLKR